METNFRFLPTCLALWCYCANVNAIERYVSPSGGHVAPFTNWVNAATNIQDAIDAASAGDVIWVTNGVYATGGKVMAGDLTNRVALDRAITVQSVNGPWVTVIKGAGATNGISAVRCAWLTNGATLMGFTLQDGATRSGGNDTLASGGGAWCASSNAIVANCVIRSNVAGVNGGGAYQGNLNNCFLSGNKAIYSGGGAYDCLLNNCTVISNSSSGAYLGRLTNSIVYFNTPNYIGSTFSYCCTTPLPSGTGNITNAPQFYADGLHLTGPSPCRGAGTNVVSGTDIDGQPWADPPSIGCDEWHPAPVIIMQPKIQFTGDPGGFTVGVVVAGQDPFTCRWTRDGAPIEDDGHYSSARATNLVATGINEFDGGSYQVVVSNAFGMVTSAVVQLTIHYVGAAGTSPLPPYLSWATAATNIQDAIDVASLGEIVLVTNGVYATGGKVMGGDLTNRVALDKAIIVHSVNGPGATIIQGIWPPTTNGPSAVRCAWLTNGAVLSGLTIRGGGTRAVTSSPNQQMNGGGVWGASTNATVFNCVIATNIASYNGGGAYRVTLNNCTLIGNHAVGSGTPGGGVAGAGAGGGAVGCNLKNCVVTGNAADQEDGGGALNCNLKNCSITKNSTYFYGGGAYLGTLINCTVTGNTSAGYGTYGAAVASATLTNCIVYGNSLRGSAFPYTNYYNCTLSYCCTDPLASGEGNMAADPQLLGDGAHLSATSPCRGAGTNSVIFGTDIDGQPWADPPAIGCDEWLLVPVIASQPKAQVGGHPLLLDVGGVIAAGQEPFTFTWSKDGAVLEDSAHYGSTHTTNLTVNGFGPADAGAYQVVASNAFGMATSAVVQVVVHCADAAGVGPVPPYSNWATAATNIQNAIDAADAGEFVVVTNGVYSAGGKVMAGDLTNRVALTKPLAVISVNGPAVTVIQGAWDPATTNGPLAVRCAWLTDGATLNGFTLQGGATRTTGDWYALQSGGGAWGQSANATVVNCVLATNAAGYGGGGCYKVLLHRCMVLGNRSGQWGGGSYQAALLNCFVQGNSASQGGGGTYESALVNCTVTGNSARFWGGGTYSQTLTATVRNCIVYFNSSEYIPSTGNTYATVGSCSYSCTTPAVSGTGNISADPQLLDGIHLAATSPCRGAGNSLYASGSDIDGESWTNPPSMGCDEIWEANITGPLSVGAEALWPTPAQEIAERGRLWLFGTVSGRASRVEWSYGDGAVLTNASYLATSHIWTNAGDYTVAFTAYNADHPLGMSTNLPVRVIPLELPLLTTGSMSGNRFQLTFNTQANVYYVVEYAMSLTPIVVWQTLSSRTGTGGVIEVWDSSPTNDARFYRVRMP